MTNHRNVIVHTASADGGRDRLEFHRSRARYFGLVLLSLGLVAAGWFVATGKEGLLLRAFGWFAALFFGWCGVAAAINLVRGGVAFSFDHSGITSDVLRDVYIPWSDVETCHVVTIRGNRFLALTFRDPERFLQRVSPANRKLALFNQRQGWGHWAFEFAGLTPGIDEALAFIRQNGTNVASAPT